MKGIFNNERVEIEGEMIKNVFVNLTRKAKPDITE